MSPSRPRKLDQVLNAPASRLGAMAAHAHRLAEVERRVLPLLEPALAPHCRLADFRDGRLVLAATSAAWATRLRYHTHEVGQKLAAAGFPVTEIRVVVAPPMPPRRPRPGPPPRMSATGAAVIAATADAVADPALADALRRLARNGGVG